MIDSDAQDIVTAMHNTVWGGKWANLQLNIGIEYRNFRSNEQSSRGRTGKSIILTLTFVFESQVTLVVSLPPQKR